MKIWPALVLIYMAGCAAPMEQLLQEAHECVDSNVNELGVIGKPSEKDRDACWDAVNKRQELLSKKEQRMDIESRNACSRNMVKFCDSWGRCSCISQSETRRILESL